MKSYLASILLLFWTLTIVCYYLLFTTPSDNGGDMVEYFGMTESLINHRSIDLTASDYQNLKKYLAPGYFISETTYEETKGGFMAYIDGTNGKRYPVHFWFYSALATPFRLLLRFFGINELFVFTITNIFILTAGLLYIFKTYLRKHPTRQILLLVLVYSSPLVFFIPYPGVDIFYPVLLLVALFAFMYGSPTLSFILIALASWHSQPLSILAAIAFMWTKGRGLVSLLQSPRRKDIGAFFAATGIWGVLFSGIVLLPYITNIVLFGVSSPWYILKDGWTTIYGFGLHNASLKRLFEQLFDLNMGLFWYAPALCIGALMVLPKQWYKKKEWWMLIGALVVTAVGYHTNPAWKYGSAGFSPTRHILFLIPFLIGAVVKYGTFNIKKRYVLGMLIPLLVQIYSLSYNGYLNPYFFNSLFHSPYARFVLDRWPSLYNPTPKIFVDNTTHTDKKFLTTAIYKDPKGKCLKAYVVSTDKELLMQECGETSITTRFPDDELTSFKTNHPRNTYVREAAFWADPESCAPAYQGDFVCVRSLKDFIQATGVTDAKRITPIQGYEGAWQLSEGDVIQITIPPGYFIKYTSLTGSYVNFK